MYDCIYVCVCICIYIYIYTLSTPLRVRNLRGRRRAFPLQAVESEGGIIRLETLIELKFLNSSFSSFFQQFSIVQFEPTVSQSTVSHPPPMEATL